MRFLTKELQKQYFFNMFDHASFIFPHFDILKQMAGEDLTKLNLLRLLVYYPHDNDTILSLFPKDKIEEAKEDRFIWDAIFSDKELLMKQYGEQGLYEEYDFYEESYKVEEESKIALFLIAIKLGYRKEFLEYAKKDWALFVHLLTDEEILLLKKKVKFVIYDTRLISSFKLHLLDNFELRVAFSIYHLYYYVISGLYKKYNDTLVDIFYNYHYKISYSIEELQEKIFFEFLDSQSSVNLKRLALSKSEFIRNLVKKYIIDYKTGRE